MALALEPQDRERFRDLLREQRARDVFEPRVWAKRFHESFYTRGTLVLHRRVGKTTEFVNYHIRAARSDRWFEEYLRKQDPTLSEEDVLVLLRGRQFAHVLPTKTQAKLVAWDMLKYYGLAFAGAEANVSDLAITFPPTPRNVMGSRVRLFGADDPDALRGYACWGVSYDEFSQMPENIHGEVMSKSLADHMGYAFFVGTLKGKNQLYRMWKAAKAERTWFDLWQDVNTSLRTESGATIRALKKGMEEDKREIAMGVQTQEWFDQEWFLSTVAAIKGAYFTKQIARADREGRFGSFPYDPELPVHDVWDLGVGPQLVVGAFQHHRLTGKWRLLKAFEGSEQDGMPEMIARLKQEPWVWGRHFAPHDVKSTEIGSGKSVWRTAARLGWKFTVVPRVSFNDGILAARNLWANLYVNEPDCEGFVEHIGEFKQHYDEKQKVFTGVEVKNQGSHYGAMMRYAGLVRNHMTIEKPQGGVPTVPPTVPIGRAGAWT